MANTTKKPRLIVVKETDTGLNQKFKDTKTNEVLNRGEVVDRIKKGIYPDYHVAKINNKNIPRSNPNNSNKDNLD